jgi:PAS domain S-box-containing protein
MGEIMTKKYDQYANLNNIKDSAIIIYQDYTIVFANEHFVNQIGISEEVIVGAKCYMLLHHSLFPCTWKSVPETECCHRQVFATGNSMNVTHQHKMPDGSKRFFQISASPIKDENGEVIEMIYISKEITKHKEL